MEITGLMTGSSVVHGLDPRLRVVTAFVLALLTALSRSTVAPALALGVGLGLVWAARLPSAMVARRLLAVNLFMLFLWLVLPFTWGGPADFAVGPLGWSSDGLGRALLITLKANGIACLFWGLVATIPVGMLGHTLIRLGIPAKLAHLLLFTYRYLHVLYEEYQRLRQAALVRGFKPRLSRHALRTYAWLVGMLLVRAFNRSQRVYEAMLCRGFKGRFYSLAPFSFSGRDCLALFFFGLFLGGMVYGEWLLNRW